MVTEKKGALAFPLCLVCLYCTYLRSESHPHVLLHLLVASMIAPLALLLILIVAVSRELGEFSGPGRGALVRPSVVVADFGSVALARFRVEVA